MILLCILNQILKRNICCRHMEGMESPEDEEEGNLAGASESSPLLDTTEGGVPQANGAVPTSGDGEGGATPAPGADQTDAGPSSGTVPTTSPGANTLKETESGIPLETMPATPGSEAMTNVPPTPSEVGPGESASNFGGSAANEIPDEPEEPVALAGKLLVEFTYVPGGEKLTVTVIRAEALPEKERGGTNVVMVHLTILPYKNQRFRTKQVAASKQVFNEKFTFVNVTPDIIEDCSMRMRLYGKERFGRRLMGEINIPLKEIDLSSPLCDEPRWKVLLPKGLVAALAEYEEKDSDEDVEPDPW